MSRGSDLWLVGLSLAAAVIGWGWAWVGIRDVVRYYEPGPLALGRYAVASLALLPVWIRGGARLPRARELPMIGAMGLLGFTFYNLGINAGEKTITAGTAALIAACIPVIVTIGARLFFAERLTRVGWIGVMVALAGVGVITGSAEGGLRLSRGALLVLFASVCAAGYGLLSKRFLARHGWVEATAWAVWAGTLGLIPSGGGLRAAVAEAPISATVQVVLLGIFPGAVCYAFWNYAIARVPLARVASWMFLIPVASVGLGWLLLDEIPPPLALIGGLVTLLGVFLVNARGGLQAGGAP
ncbi:MAG: DMT family transporter [Verrucomicrobiae bacterium]|nr:DMT family transporter [Verrucomicrobiae bacterium]